MRESVYEQPQLGKALRRRRRGVDRTQQQVADACGVNHTYICHIEAGRREPSLPLLRAILKATAPTP